MKKTIILLALVVVITVPNVFGLGIGGAFGFGNFPAQAVLSIKPDKTDAVFGIGFSLSSDSFQIGATADWWMYHTDLVGTLNLYIGPGLYLSLSDSNVNFGARIPVGLQAFVIDPLELFVELAPTIGVGGIPDSVNFPEWGWQGAFGFRFWF